MSDDSQSDKANYLHLAQLVERLSELNTLTTRDLIGVQAEVSVLRALVLSPDKCQLPASDGVSNAREQAYFAQVRAAHLRIVEKLELPPAIAASLTPPLQSLDDAGPSAF